MFLFRYSSIFKNRWIAVLFAIWICYMAVDFVGTPSDANSNATITDETGAPVDKAAVDSLKKTLEGL